MASPARLARARFLAALIAASGAGVTTAAEETAALYGRLCASCHGADLLGGKGPGLLGQLPHGDSDEALRRAIANGFPATGMPAFGTTVGAGELQALVVHLQEKRANLVLPPPVPPLDQQQVRRSEAHSFRIEAIVQDGLQVPWSFAFLPDGRILLTERVGRLRIIEHGRLLPEPVGGIPAVIERGEGGLMAVAVDPDHARTGWVYLAYSDPGEGETSMTRIVRGRLRENRLVNQETIFALPRGRYAPGYVLFGGRIEFHGGFLFFTVGERGVTGAAQDVAVPLGKVHRVRPDGSVPPDNPFARRPGAVASLWTLGHRNPQGLAIDPATGAIWEAEHGPRGGDELNRLEPGRNYGWPVVTHGINYDGTPVSDRQEQPGLEPPARYWTPSIAVSQVAFYSGDRFPRWKGNLFLGSLARQKLIRFEVEGARIVHEEEVFSGLGRIRDIRTGPDGLLYLALEQLHGASGWLVRLVPVEP